MNKKDIMNKINAVNDLLNSISNELINNKQYYNIQLNEIDITLVYDIVPRKKYYIEIIVEKENEKE